MKVKWTFRQRCEIAVLAALVQLSALREIVHPDHYGDPDYVRPSLRTPGEQARLAR